MADANMRSTIKNDLMKAVLQTTSTEVQPEVTIDNIVFIVHLMALIRTIRETHLKLPSPFMQATKELTLSLIVTSLTQSKHLKERNAVYHQGSKSNQLSQGSLKTLVSFYLTAKLKSEWSNFCLK